MTGAPFVFIGVTRAHVYASVCMYEGPVGSGVKHLRKKATRGTAQPPLLCCKTECEEDSQKDLFYFLRKRGSNGSRIYRKIHRFVHHQSSSNIHSSISELELNDQALRVEASFTSFNEQCAGQASAAQLSSAQQRPVETNEMLWLLFRDTAHARSNLIFCLGDFNEGPGAKVTHL